MHGEVDELAVPLDGEDGLAAAIARDAGAGHEGLEEVGPVGDLGAVDRPDGVARLQPRLGGRAGDGCPIRQGHGRGNVADAGGGHFLAGRLSDKPKHRGQDEGEEDIEDGAGDKDDHLRRVAHRRQASGIGGGAALQRAQIGQLREQHVAANGQPGDAVLDPILAMPGPDGRAEANGEAIDLGAAAAGGQEVSQLMDENRAAEEQDDQEDRPEVAKQGAEENGHGWTDQTTAGR